MIKVLQDKRSTILSEWIRTILEDYPQESIRVLTRKNDQFANPLKHNIETGAADFLDQLLELKEESDDLSETLLDLVQIKAVQDFTPSHSLSFINRLRDVIFQTMKEDMHEPGYVEGWLGLEKKIDRTLLQAFDHYVNCRERMHSVRTAEVKRNNHMLNRLAEKSKGEKLSSS